MINRFLLFMKMLLTGIFKFAVGAVVYFACIIGVFILAEMITRLKILTILSLVVLAGVTGFVLFILADDFWDNYKRERDFRGL